MIVAAAAFNTGKLKFPINKEDYGRFVNHEIPSFAKFGFSNNLHYILFTPAELAADLTILVADNNIAPLPVADFPQGAAPTGSQINIRDQQLRVFDRNLADHKQINKDKGIFHLNLASAVNENQYVLNKVINMPPVLGNPAILSPFNITTINLYGALKQLFVSGLSTGDIDELLNKQRQQFKFKNNENKEDAINGHFVFMEKINQVIDESRGQGNHIIEADKIRLLKVVFTDHLLKRAFENVSSQFTEPTYQQYKEAIINWTKYLNSTDQARNSSIIINQYANEVNNVVVPDLHADMAELAEFRKAAAAAAVTVVTAVKDKKLKKKFIKGKKFPGAVYCEIHKWCGHTTKHCRQLADKDDDNVV